MNKRTSGAFNAIISLLWLTILFHNPQRCVPIPAAKVIVQVAFNAIGFKDVAKHQLVSCIKKYGLKPAKEAQNLDKERTAQIVASYLLDNKIVHSNSGKELKHVTRADIIKTKAF